MKNAHFLFIRDEDDNAEQKLNKFDKYSYFHVIKLVN